MKIIAITQARYGSTRLPGKILKKINGKSLLEIHLERASKSEKIDELIVATTFEKESSEICRIAKNLGLKIYQGSTLDVLDRYYQAAKPEKPDYVIRITSDCPLIDSEVIDKVITHALANDVNYCSNVFPPTFPDGMDVEIFKFAELEEAWIHSKQLLEREHVTLYIHDKCKNKNSSCSNYVNKEDYSNFRLTVDTLEDFDLVDKLVTQIGDDKSWRSYVDHIIANPELFQINSKHKRNEGYLKNKNEK